VAGATGQNLGREHSVDPEQLELDGVAPGLGRAIDEAQRPFKLAPVIARRLGDELWTACHESRPLAFNRF
jgi:hypothetical protein